MSDEQAVLVEPAARRHPRRAAHVAGAERHRRPVVAVLGAGTMGLLRDRRSAPVRARACRSSSAPATRTSSALAKALGADIVVKPDELIRAVRRVAGCHVVGDHLSGGADATIDAVGNSASIADCLRFTRPARPRRADGHAGRGDRRPDRSVAPRDAARRRLHVRHRDHADGIAATRSIWPSTPRTRSASSGCCRPPTASTTTRTRSPTPPPAGRRGAVKVAFDLRPRRVPNLKASS